MTRSRLILRSATYYWRTNLAVVLGVGTAVAVLAGALLVGDSVRGSLRDIAVARLGRTDQVLAATGFFPDGLADRVRTALPDARTAPLVVANGFVTHEPSGRRAGGVLVYGVDERFWRFHGLNPPGDVMVSPALARELAVTPGDVLLTRLQKPSAIPIESLFGRKDDVGRTLRLSVGGVLGRDQLGEFALRPQQSEVRAVFAPLQRVQRDLGVDGRANTVLIAGGDESAVGAGVRTALTLDDLDARVSLHADPRALAVESGMGVLSGALEAAARAAAQEMDLTPIPVFAYLANTLRTGDRQVPYSLIAATDLAQLPNGPGQPAHDAIVLNEWAARELGATPGDRITVEYYLWDAERGLTTHDQAFTLDRVVPIAGLAADRRLAPEYPGITSADSLADWDPPFPIDLSRVRPEDETYWDEHRTTPKAFIPFESGRALWETRYGGATSIRIALPPGADAAAVADRWRRGILQRLSTQSMGLTVTPVRRRALEASEGATDFGEYFTYFSFFLVASALLLAVLFFRLGVEQRLRQIGILRAAGFPIAGIRRLLLAEALILSIAGGIVGAAGAIGYARLIVYGLKTWWIGAVGTTLLDLHVSWVSIAAGVAGGIVAAVLCVVVSLRAVARLSPRALMTAQAIDGSVGDVRRARRSRFIAAALGVTGLGMLADGAFSPAAQAGLFFGAAAALLAAAMFLFSAWVRARDVRLVSGRGTAAVARLGFRSAAHRPSRSVMSAALIASAAFIVVSVDAFRHGAVQPGGDLHSGTGGYALLATSELPLLQDPDDPAGRDALSVNEQDLAGARFTSFRVMPGDNASCLNLYRPTRPTIIAPEPGFIESNRFSFASSLAETDEERANPWLLLKRPSDAGTVPAIADATSLQYVLHLGVGDVMAIDTGGPRPLQIRFVAALSDSVLQGEVIVAEDAFTNLFPAQQGYRFFLVDGPPAQAAAEPEALAGSLERALTAFGFDAVSTSERLESFHQVENTYLSTFQALGGLGLLLGTIGLSAIMFRNALERRRELALLRAVGFDRGRVRIVILAEAVLLLSAGLAAGVACAVVAVAPAWLGRHGSLPGAGLALLLLGVAVAGLISSFIATRAALGGNILAALRAE